MENEPLRVKLNDGMPRFKMKSRHLLNHEFDNIPNESSHDYLNPDVPFEKLARPETEDELEMYQLRLINEPNGYAIAVGNSDFYDEPELIKEAEECLMNRWKINSIEE